MTGINPSCSELVLRLGVPWDEDAVRERITELLNGTDKIELGLFQYDWEASYKDANGNPVPEWDRHQVVRGGFDPKYLGFREVDNGADSPYYEMTVALNKGSIIDSKLQLKDLETLGQFDANLYRTDGKNGRIGFTDMDDEACIMIGDYDQHEFPVIAEACRVLNARWHPYDGGHEDSFKEWCNANGYEDVAEMSSY